MKFPITTQKEIRSDFWKSHQGHSRRRIRDYSGTSLMYTADTRVAFCDFIDHLQRDGQISSALAQRATL